MIGISLPLASTIFVVINAVTLSAVSWWYFKEPLTMMQIFGIVLGIGVVIILELAPNTVMR